VREIGGRQRAPSSSPVTSPPFADFVEVALSLVDPGAACADGCSEAHDLAVREMAHVLVSTGAGVSLVVEQHPVGAFLADAGTNRFA
jgi:hypothetical protein